MVLATFAAVAGEKAYNLKIWPAVAHDVQHITDVTSTGSAQWSGLAADTYTVCIKVEGVGGPYDDCGSVTIHGQDIRDVTQASLRPVNGLVPQDTVLFNDTVNYKIAYGRTGAREGEIKEAARRAPNGK